MDFLLLVSQTPNGALSARRFPGGGTASFHYPSKFLRNLSSGSSLGLYSQNPRKTLNLTLSSDDDPASSRRSPLFFTRDDEAVFSAEEAVHFRGVTLLGKSRMLQSFLSLAILALLACGDLLCLLAFSAIGRFSHGLPITDIETLKTADPYIAGWLLSAYFLGGYGDDGKGIHGYREAMAAAARSWIVGIPLGIIIKAVTANHIPDANFVLMAMGGTGILLLGWRMLACKNTL